MNIVENETIVWCDIDNTLAMWREPEIPGKHKIAIKYGDRLLHLTPHRPNIDLIKEYRNRGYYIIAHSANGWGHVKRVIEALGLEDYVHQGMSKCIKVVDDRPPEDWIGALVYLPEDFYDNTNIS